MPSALLPARDVRLPPPQALGQGQGQGPATRAPHHHEHEHEHEHEHDDDSDSHSHSHSHHSGESHSSHSSYARRHAPPDAPPPPTSTTPPTLAALSVVLLLLLLHAGGLALFTRGFLLTRRQLDGVRAAGCAGGLGLESYVPPVPLFEGQEGGLEKGWSALSKEECALPGSVTYDRAIILIVDALRYDFLAPLALNSSTEWQPHPNQHGHLTSPAQLVQRHPGYGFLSHFYADPPTTTLQRIKGLTTGTLPTFVDASANFGGGQRIEEDNWIEQLRRAKNGSGDVVFGGDDTWMGLFPAAFDKATPFDSFNVHDLDTVDEGVRRVLAPYLSGKKKGEQVESWSLLLMHTLGLDHAGHRFSSTHPSVKRKLGETDVLVRQIVDALAPEPSAASDGKETPRTLFVLMGDHGMDPQGDHGGDAELEVGAGLFVWSSGRPGGFPGPSSSSSSSTPASEPHPDVSNLLARDWGSSQAELVSPPRVPFSPLGDPSITHRSVAQVDLVPSLSLLLGLPIPFNSLGTVIPELFAQAEFDSPSSPVADPGRDVLLRALRMNAHQIRKYLRAYSSGSDGGGGGGDDDTAPRRGGALGSALEDELEDLWQSARRADAHFASLVHAPKRGPDELTKARKEASAAYFLFTRAALTRARLVWATFEMRAIYLGLALLVAACAACGGVWVDAGVERRVGSGCDAVGWVGEDGNEDAGPGTVRLARRIWGRAAWAFVGVGVPSLAVWVAVEMASPGFRWSWAAVGRVAEMVGWSGGMGAAISIALVPFFQRSSSLFPPSAPSSAARRAAALTSSSSSSTSGKWIGLLGPALIHAALFASNSTILREDFIVLLGLGFVLLLMFLSLASRLPRSTTVSSSSSAVVTETKTKAAGEGRAENGGPLRTSRRNFVLVKAALLCLTILLCARLGRYGSLCREEHGPSCISNFYAAPSARAVRVPVEEAEGEGGEGHVLAPHMGVSGGLAALGEGGATNSIPSIVLAYICAYFLPGVLQTLLSYARFGGGERSEGNVGVAPRFLGWVLRPALLAAAGHWAADRLAGDVGLTTGAGAGARVGEAGGDRTAEWAAGAAVFVGRTSAVLLGIAAVFWLLAPICIEFRQVDVPVVPGTAAGAATAGRKQVQLLGFGNAFGSTYLLLVSVVFGLLFLSAQPSGQVTLSLGMVALVLLSELGAELRSVGVIAGGNDDDGGAGLGGTLWASALALLAHNTFFSTGHQATLSAIQWRTAFVLTRSVRYPWSPLLVVLNAVGPLAVFPAVGCSLGVLWGLVGRAPVVLPSGRVSEDEDEDEDEEEEEEEEEGVRSAAELADTKAERERKKKISAAHMYTVLDLLRAQVCLTLYFTVLTLGSAVWGTAMRRHLMLYKVWTPRFMLAAMGGVGVQVVGGVVGVGVVGCVVLAKGAAMFGSRFR
ncbi:hypothetical protein A4X06_0g2745 [Tilletia controversa]|uniref:GPI ethanolamine phosphate transferase 3 n=1 Tax=Tilletia controversa TaxID=13291 RepID=A0A8X7SY49_9BASI|nr:hypothetical protein CF328_g3573 [Tilletia controversa]KAE8251295.1 hypothetical protein A4X06_0g2745 [Tilletia controversa]